MLEVADLTLDYPDFHARYSLDVPAGALCGLIGPSGGGKTTLLHADRRLRAPERGALRFAGRDLLPLAPAERPLSMLFQDHNLFPHLTAAENVGLGIDPRLRLRQEQAREVEAALERVGLAGLGERRPAELSGGQRQRVAIARALVRKRPLMLLDEPFGGLDPGLRREMIALVDRLRRDEGLTVLVSIHTPEDLGGSGRPDGLHRRGQGGRRCAARRNPRARATSGDRPLSRALRAPRGGGEALPRYMDGMKKHLVIAGAVVFLAIIAASIVPMWVMTADVRLSGFALAMIALMVVGCFGVGGGLMFLIFYSARKGYDDAVGSHGWLARSRRRRKRKPGHGGRKCRPDCWQLNRQNGV